MEFHKKLQALRREKGLTQEQLARQLYVSRTAISKWESGRGYPGIDSLKAIARFYDITLDQLLNGEALLEAAEQQTGGLQTLVFGLLDCSAALLLFLPLLGQGSGDTIRAVSLLQLTGTAPYLLLCYWGAVLAMAALGLLTLALQNWQQPRWQSCRGAVSLALNCAAALLFILGRQPYGATFLFLALVIKLCMGAKGR